MAELKLNKKDIIWSYIAQFLSMGAGALTLPFILNKLSTAEIGFNYILLTVGSVIALVDLGFAPQFARNFTYVLSGVQELRKEGVGETDKEINYGLLAYLLTTARYVYAVLAVFALILLIVVGTPYIYKTTDGFTAVPNAQWVWLIYSLGVLFQIFYSYYFSMLLGAGKIKEQKYAVIGNKLLYIIILISGLYMDWGLLSIALAQLISPFFGRFLSHRYFYTPELVERLSAHPKRERSKIIEIFNILWYNAKRLAVMQIGGYAIVKFNMFIAGLFISLDEFASYGLMVQLLGIISTLACTYLQISQPKFASLRASKNDDGLLRSFSFSQNIFYVLFIACSVILVVFGQGMLDIIKSNATLPSQLILTVYCIVIFLESNHSNFAVLISSNNNIPFAPASITTGIAVCIGTFFVVRYTDLGILGLVIVQGICQAAYQNWKWPLVALDEFHISFFKLMKMGIPSHR
ncbi:MAG: polysaccharide biosynthesis protein [Muribaculaceae bacterium]|nr:polysaccharide biosynthesis protein [Muribaculaceae bacterium]